MMNWIAALSLSVLILALFAALAIRAIRGGRRKNRVPAPLRLLIAGVFLAAFVCLLPIYGLTVKEGPVHALKTVLFSLHHAFRLFSAGGDWKTPLENLACPQPWLTTVYSVYLSLLFILAPMLTLGFLLSFFRNASAAVRCLLHYFSDACFFSDLNDRSLALAADIRRNHPKTLLVFACGKRGGQDPGLAARATALGGVCFGREIAALPYARRPASAALTFFMIGENEADNIAHALKIAAACRDRKKTWLYVFAGGPESELLLSGAAGGEMKLRRVDAPRSLIQRCLYEYGPRLFEHALPVPGGEKRRISAVIAGLGRHGGEMLRALVWYCQMDGYEIVIDAFDRDPLAGERLAARCPELLSEKYNGVSVPGEAEYTVRIHAGIDVTAARFAGEIAKLPRATYVLTALGSDEANIRAAAELRMLFERMDAHPVIQAIVYGADAKERLGRAVNQSGQPYDIECIGDIATAYSEAVVLNSELEQKALASHLKWGEEEKFWQYEYYHRSSVAAALHILARAACGIPGADKREEELTEPERAAIAALEHRRWTAYMRSEGYVHGDRRNDLAKTHDDLVDFSALDEAVQRLDSRVGTL